MANIKRVEEDDEMLLPGEDDTIVLQPQEQHPYAGAPVAMGSFPPPHQPYPPPHQPYPHGAAVPMGMMAGGQAYHHNTTTVIVNQPAPVVTGPREWSSTLCSCCDDMGSCMMGTFCPLVLACQISMEMEESMCVPCCVPGWLIVLRTKMRAQNKIQGTVMDDCCMNCWCGHCVMCQMARELKFIRRSY
ncbi:hypothetical protein ACOMHN_048055 [Nucella lapillus]